MNVVVGVHPHSLLLKNIGCPNKSTTFMLAQSSLVLGAKCPYTTLDLFNYPAKFGQVISEGLLLKPIIIAKFLNLELEAEIDWKNTFNIYATTSTSTSSFPIKM